MSEAAEKRLREARAKGIKMCAHSERLFLQIIEDLQNATLGDLRLIGGDWRIFDGKEWLTVPSFIGMDLRWLFPDAPAPERIVTALDAPASAIPPQHRPLYEELKRLAPSASIEPDKLNGTPILRWKRDGQTHVLTPKDDGTIEVGDKTMTAREFVQERQS